MAVDGISPALAIRSSVGIELWSSTAGLKGPFELDQRFPREETKNCRSMVFSPDGRYFAYTNGNIVKIMKTIDWTEQCQLPRPKAFHLKFSPRGNYLVTWELYTVTKDKTEGAPNMYVYKSDTGEEVFSIIQKKQTDWEPCWSSDETLFAMMIGGEAFFYELNTSDGFKSSARKLGGGRGGVLSLAPGNSPPFLAFYVPGAKGSPSMCKIYKYPALQQNQTVACKSFFQADRVEMMWNKRGTGLLLLTSTDVDQTGASYYGKQALHFLSTKGDSFAVSLGKEGPIHAVTWSPKGTEFLVVYGYMPSKATLFNLKCDVVFDFGEGSRNCAYFNDFGNLLILAGFGNLRGYVEIWDVIKKLQIASPQAPDSTFLDWSPTGETFITATTAPRLRIGNGFKVWHYSGALLHETLWPQGQELLEVGWQKFSEGIFKENPISDIKVEGIKPSQPEASKQVYQPPNVRLMKDGKLPAGGDAIPQPTIPGLPPGYTSQKNVSNSKRKRNRPLPSQRDNNKNPDKSSTNTKTSPKNEVNKTNSTTSTTVPTTTENNSNEINNQNQQQQHHSKTTGHHHHYQQKSRRGSRNDKNYISTGDPDKDKKIRNIQKKLQDITKLKAKKNKGEFLEANQLTKIASETSLIEELKALQITPSTAASS